MSDTTVNIPDDADNPLVQPGIDKQTVTNDAVAGETVIDTGHYAGPTGSEPLEGTPTLGENDLAGEDIDLDDGE
ncbi:hypothetical protein [Marisediminicola sp. LYQ134]|uniref:hypothetical protein n=1 Tax=unclassified Marisediminicola TaxID=2618316 RepID=UPI00398367B7